MEIGRRTARVSKKVLSALKQEEWFIRQEAVTELPLSNDPETEHQRLAGSLSEGRNTVIMLLRKRYLSRQDHLPVPKHVQMVA